MRTAEEWAGELPTIIDTDHPYLCGEDFIRAIQRDALTAAADCINKITRDEMSLAAGEMTLAEWRAILAMRAVVSIRLRDLANTDAKEGT